MSFFRRRESIEETMERLRLATCECSGLGLEEEDASEVVETIAKGETNMNVQPAPKEFCCKCHMSFGLAEKRVAVVLGKVMHEDCYAKHLHEEKQRSDRITVYVNRTIH